MWNCSLDPKTLSDIFAHAKVEYPRECCGVVIVKSGKHRYVPCKNISESVSSFHIDPQDYASAEDDGEVAFIVHSHPDRVPAPSEADLVSCEKSGLPWVIVSCPTQLAHEFHPSGYVQPLIGRQFSHGVFDCYSLIRDYYAENLQVELPDFERREEWWLKGDNLYLENFQKAGFVEVDIQDLKEHDGLIMQIGSPVPNHAAVYVGDGLIVQHCMNRLSSKDILGGYWKRCVVKAVRYMGDKNA